MFREVCTDVLDRLIHSKSRIQRGKLEVLASEIVARFGLWDRNLSRIDGYRAHIQELLGTASRMARYRLRPTHDPDHLKRQLLDLEKERRGQDLDCWRDVTNVMRDFLSVFEVHEQAKSKAIFFNDARSGLEDDLWETEASHRQPCRRTLANVHCSRVFAGSSGSRVTHSDVGDATLS